MAYIIYIAMSNSNILFLYGFMLISNMDNHWILTEASILNGLNHAMPNTVSGNCYMYD